MSMLPTPLDSRSLLSYKNSSEILNKSYKSRLDQKIYGLIEQQKHSLFVLYGSSYCRPHQKEKIVYLVRKYLFNRKDNQSLNALFIQSPYGHSLKVESDSFLGLNQENWSKFYTKTPELWKPLSDYDKQVFTYQFSIFIKEFPDIDEECQVIFFALSLSFFQTKSSVRDKNHHHFIFHFLRFCYTNTSLPYLKKVSRLIYRQSRLTSGHRNIKKIGDRLGQIYGLLKKLSSKEESQKNIKKILELPFYIFSNLDRLSKVSKFNKDISSGHIYIYFLKLMQFDLEHNPDFFLRRLNQNWSNLYDLETLLKQSLLVNIDYKASLFAYYHCFLRDPIDCVGKINFFENMFFDFFTLGFVSQEEIKPFIKGLMIYLETHSTDLSKQPLAKAQITSLGRYRYFSFISFYHLKCHSCLWTEESKNLIHKSLLEHITTNNHPYHQFKTLINKQLNAVIKEQIVSFKTNRYFTLYLPWPLEKKIVSEVDNYEDIEMIDKKIHQDLAAFLLDFKEKIIAQWGISMVFFMGLEETVKMHLKMLNLHPEEASFLIPLFSQYPQLASPLMARLDRTEEEDRFMILSTFKKSWSQLADRVYVTLDPYDLILMQYFIQSDDPKKAFLKIELFLTFFSKYPSKQEKVALISIFHTLLQNAHYLVDKNILGSLEVFELFIQQNIVEDQKTSKTEQIEQQLLSDGWENEKWLFFFETIYPALLEKYNPTKMEFLLSKALPFKCEKFCLDEEEEPKHIFDKRFDLFFHTNQRVRFSR